MTMSNPANDSGALELKPLPYHEALRDYLRAEEADVWHWYASNKVRDEQAEAVRFELLKSTYRVEREAQPETYGKAEEVARRLGLDVPDHHLPGSESPGVQRLAGLRAGRGPRRPARSRVRKVDRCRVPGPAGP